METIIIAKAEDVKQWIREGIQAYFEESRFPQPIDNVTEALLSRTQIIQHLDNISLVTLHAWMKQGLPHHKQGGRVYFLKSEVLDYIKSKT